MPDASNDPAQTQPTLASMYALGHAGLPATIETRGVRYTLERVVKHDFWAGTGFYRADDGTRAVAKINRRVSLFGLPLRWTGKILRHREVRAYTKLQDLPNIPRLLGDATDTGFVHAFIEGDPLRKGTPVPDGFFAELLALVDALNARGIAYVDTNKPENILLGVDGRPYLIDFQISFDASAWWPRWIGRRLLKINHDADVYHVLKQKRRFRPDQLTPDELHRLEHRAWPIRLHRAIATPFRKVRRVVLRWMERRGWIGPELSK